MQRLNAFLSLLLALTFFNILPSLAQNSEKITLITYYPSPVGIYRTLRLFPINNEKNITPCDKNNEGFLYYNDIEGDDNQHRLMLCRETAADIFQWRPVGEYIRPEQSGSGEMALSKIQQRLLDIEEETDQVMHSYRTKQISEDKAKAMLRILAKEEITFQNTLDYQAEQRVESLLRGVRQQEKK